MTPSPLGPDEGFRALAETLPVAICRWKPDTTLTWANRMYREFVAGREDVVGLPWIDAFVPEEERDAVAAFYCGLVQSPRTVGMEHEVVDARGRRRIFQWTDQPVLDLDGRVVAFHSVGIDITGQREAEEERRALEAQLRRVEGLESLSRAASGVAHDFNNLLGVILGWAELALAPDAPEDELRRSLPAIRDAAERATQLTRRLMSHARREPVRPVPVHLDRQIAGLLPLLRRIVGEDIQLSWVPAERLPLVHADPGSFDQAILNLALNARDAIADRRRSGAAEPREVGRITLRTMVVEPGEEDGVSLLPGEVPVEAAAFVRVSMTDDGAGIDPDDAERLFEPFRSTKPEGRGTGLGLATVRTAVEGAGGFVRVSGAVGEGATFALYFPVPAGEPSESAVPSALPEGLTSRVGELQDDGATLAGRGEGVLLVEDGGPLREVLHFFLVRCGYTVLEAATAEEAIELARGRGREIDLLLTDLVLPGANGKELASAVRELVPRLRVLFMSGYPEDAFPGPELPEVAGQFIQKPFSEMALARKLRALLDADGASGTPPG